LFTGLAGCRAACGQPNETQIENQNPGTTAWQLSNPAANREIEGYASLTSVNRGGTIGLFVNTAEAQYTMEIYRTGWYGGTGGRLMVPAITLEGINQPMPTPDPATLLVECNWTNPYMLTIPNTWVSGVYLVKLTGLTSGTQSYIIFVVREDSRNSASLFQTAVTTYQAYNNWPGANNNGHSLYSFDSANGVAAYKVSFNRPYYQDFSSTFIADVGSMYYLRWEYNMVRWMESQGYDVAYCTNLDIQEIPNLLLSHRAYLSVGHDEYWTWQMRSGVIAARDAGVGIGFFSANTGYWQIRLEGSTINGTVDRNIVGYKEHAYLDPVGTQSCYVTSQWRQNPCVPSEQSFIGVEYIEGDVNADMVIVNPSHWSLAGTGLVNGSVLPGLIGYEADGNVENNSPAGTTVIAQSPIPNGFYSQMVSYTAASGATVFATGSIQWSWGLDDWGVPSQRASVLNPAAQQIARNVLARLTSATSTPAFTISKSHSGSFPRGSTGSYTITVNNTGTAPTSGTVSMTDTVPTGLTATSLTGAGWSCSLTPSPQCTRADALAAGASYPPITLSVSVAANAPATVTNTATVAGGGATNTATATDPTSITGGSSGGPVSDDFTSTTLNTSLWTFVNPAGGSYSLTGTHLLLSVPGGATHDPWYPATDNAVRMMQSIGNVNFDVIVKFDSIPGAAYTNEGIIVEQDGNNFLRFELSSDGNRTNLYAASIIGGTQVAYANGPIAAGTGSFWLEVKRAGDTWTENWSTNGVSFTTGISFNQSLTTARIGPFGSNWQNPPSATPAFTASINYFHSQ
jgi:uncharacterized repeat protein (TIGR01451 family)